MPDLKKKNQEYLDRAKTLFAPDGEFVHLESYAKLLFLLGPQPNLLENLEKLFKFPFHPSYGDDPLVGQKPGNIY